MAGDAARVGELTVQGDPELFAEEAEAICKLRPGTRVRGDLLQTRRGAAQKTIREAAPVAGANDGGRAGLPSGEQHGGLHL